MSNENGNSDELGGVTEGIVGAKSKKKPMNPKFKKLLTWTIIAAAVSAAIYGLVPQSTEPVPQTPSVTAEAGATNAEGKSVEEDVEEPIEPSELTSTPVLSIFGKPVHDDGEQVVDEPAQQTADVEIVKPIVSDGPSMTPAGGIVTSEVLEKSTPSIGSAGTDLNRADAAASTPNASEPATDQEAMALSEARTAAFNGSNDHGANSTTTAEQRDPGRPLNPLPNQQPSAATGPNLMAMPSHGALPGASNLRVTNAESIAGHVSKLKYANDQVYFVKVAKMLPTKILLLPDPKAKVISFVSNSQDWEVKQFVDGVLIVELKANSGASSVSDLLIQQGDRYYSFTLASANIVAERNNMVIFTK